MPTKKQYQELIAADMFMKEFLHHPMPTHFTGTEIGVVKWNPETDSLQLIIDNMNTNYQRVLPRDLFNEAKLLKCIGRLVIKIHDGLAPQGLSFDHKGDPFKIVLLEEGSLMISNIKFTIGGELLTFQTTYNSKSEYPLFLYRDYTEYAVFDEQGNFDPEFVQICATIKKEGAEAPSE